MPPLVGLMYLGGVADLNWIRAAGELSTAYRWSFRVFELRKRNFAVRAALSGTAGRRGGGGPCDRCVFHAIADTVPL